MVTNRLEHGSIHGNDRLETPGATEGEALGAGSYLRLTPAECNRGRR